MLSHLLACLEVCVSGRKRSICINLKMQHCKERQFVVLHGITEWLRLEEISGDHLVQSHRTSKIKYSRLLRVTFSQVLGISKGGDSTTSLGNLSQCLIIVTALNKCLNGISVFQFVPIASYSSIEHQREEPSSFFTSSHKVFIHAVKIVHVVFRVGYQQWAHLYYWLLILVTVHIPKIIIARKLFYGSGY